MRKYRSFANGAANRQNRPGAVIGAAEIKSSRQEILGEKRTFERPSRSISTAKTQSFGSRAGRLLRRRAINAHLPTRKAPEAVPVVTDYDWTGIYFGGNIGWA